MPNPYISKVYLLDVPLENDYKNTLYFSSKATQQAYFQSRIQKSYTDFSYQRKDFKIRIPAHIDSLYGCNYVMYQNTYYSNKWFYAFITKMEYIDDGRTDVFIETDVMQTWYFDFTVKPSFVEREHVSDDTIGHHILDEGLELGEYISNGMYVDDEMNSITSDMCYIVGTTIGTILDPDEDKFPPAGSGVYNGIYSGVKYYRFDSTSAIDVVLELYATKGQSDAVTGIFMLPKKLAPLDEDSIERIVAESDSPYTYNINRPKDTSLDGYIPENNKLKTFPYCYMLISNNQGGNVVYHYEDFDSNNCQFKVVGALVPGGSIKMIPKNFKGISENYEESINLGKFPICNFATDMYTNWLTQNSVNIATNIVGAGIQIAGGVAAMATGAGAVAGTGMIANGGLQIAHVLGEKHKASLVPPQVNGNINSGDVVTSDSKNAFIFYNMSIKHQYARIIDDYFSMFGYKVHKVKTPNKAHRAHWWYTKTIDVNIDGPVPNDDMQIIKNAYNNGITFWRNASEISNYTLHNNIQIDSGAVTD